MEARAASKFPLYGACFDTSPFCQVRTITSRFSGSLEYQSPYFESIHTRPTFRKSPFLPEILHKVLQVLETKILLIQPVSIKRLTKPPIQKSIPALATQREENLPAGIPSPKSLKPNLPLLLIPSPKRHPILINTVLPGPSRWNPLSSKQSTLHTFQKHLIMQGRPSRATERDHQIHKIGILRRPLETLRRSHRPSYYGEEMLDS